MFKKLLKTKSIISYALVAPLLIFGLAAVLPGCKERNVQSAELEFWGVYDDSDIYKELIEDFNRKYPRVKINYYKKNYATYENDLLNAIATGRGPDIMFLHHTWVPKYEDKI